MMKQQQRKAVPGSRLARGLSAALLVLMAATASAHDGDPAPEVLNFDRPEAWALKYFASATLLGGLDTSDSRPPWSIAIGGELGWLPSLSPAERLVGFDGTKPEDLNKAPFFVRPRVTIGLPARFALTVAADPPIRVFGLKPRLIALALEHPIYESKPWIVGLRGYGQIGTVEGAYTCPSGVLAFAPGSPGNLYGCQAESSDTASLRFAGAEVSVLRQPALPHRLSPHLAVAVNYMDVGFQVNALTFGFVDQTHYTAHGITFSGTAGVSYTLTARVNAAVDAFYTPLMVDRSSGQQNNGLFNVRALLTYRLR